MIIIPLGWLLAIILTQFTMTTYNHDIRGSVHFMILNCIMVLLLLCVPIPKGLFRPEICCSTLNHQPQFRKVKKRLDLYLENLLYKP